MQSGVFAFIVINVNRDILGDRMGSVGEFHAFEVGREDVVGFTSRHALGELAVVVGIHLPTDLLGLVLGAAHFYTDAVDGPIVWTPYRSNDEGVRLLRVGVTLGGTEHSGGQAEKQKQEASERKQPCKSQARGEPRSSHRLHFPRPLPRRLLHSRLQPLSIRAEWW